MFGSLARTVSLRGHPSEPEECEMSEPFTFDRYMALPRLTALKLSPGRQAARGGGEPARFRGQEDEDGALAGRSGRTGEASPRSLARRRASRSPTFLRDGSLLFTSARPDPDVKEDPEHKINALWLLPAEGGEARLLLAPDGGVDSVAVAREADAIAFGAPVHPEAKDLADDAARAKARKEAGVGALLFDTLPDPLLGRVAGSAQPAALRRRLRHPPTPTPRPGSNRAT